MNRFLQLGIICGGILLAGCSLFTELSEGGEARKEQAAMRQHFADFSNPEKHIANAVKYAAQELRLTAAEIKFLNDNPPQISTNADGTMVAYFWPLATDDGIQVTATASSLTMVSARRGLSQVEFFM